MAERTCSVDGCERPVGAQGHCKPCYYRLRRAGTLQIVNAKLAKPRKPRRPCRMDGCEVVAVCRGLCERHYTRWKRHGDPLGWGYLPLAQRFWAKVDIAGPVPLSCPHLGRCWIWTASCQPKGYGIFGVTSEQNVLAHRFAYERCLRPIPDGLELDHLCKNRSCVNPIHLEPVTHVENVRRAWT